MKRLKNKIIIAPCVIIMSKKTWLGGLGYVLGPALGIGCKIVLQPEDSISLIATLLVELAEQSG